MVNFIKNLFRAAGHRSDASGDAPSYEQQATVISPDYDRAIADFSQAIALNHDFARAYYGRGLAYQQLGDETQAAADLKRAYELDPKLGNW